MSVPAVLSRLQLPMIGSPMFIISNPDSVLALCKAGVVGSFPSLNARPADKLEGWLQRITEELAAYNDAHPDAPAAPFAVNQIVHRSNDRLEHDLALCVKYKVPIVITSLGAREDVNQAVHGYGGIVLHDVINNRFAHKAIEKGADGLIAVAPVPAAMPGRSRLLHWCRRSANGSTGRWCCPAPSPTVPRSLPRRRWAPTLRTWARR